MSCMWQRHREPLYPFIRPLGFYRSTIQQLPDCWRGMVLRSRRTIISTIEEACKDTIWFLIRRSKWERSSCEFTIVCWKNKMYLFWIKYFCNYAKNLSKFFNLSIDRIINYSYRTINLDFHWFELLWISQVTRS